MAEYRAVSNGVASDLARWEVWNGSAWIAATVLPTVNDDVYANGFTVTIDIDFFASSYRNGVLAIGVAINGTFVINDGLVVIGDVVALGTVVNGSCLTPATNAVVTLIGNVINQNPVGVVTGNHGIRTVTGTITVIGDVSFNNTASVQVANQNLPIKADGGQVIVKGSAEAISGSNIGVGVRNNGLTSDVIIEGRATGIGGERSGAINCIIGECEGRNVNCIVTEKFIMPSNNQTAWINCRAKAGANVQIEIYDELGNAILCNPLFAQDQAAPADVRLGTTYANGALTGTLAVPNPATVALGVPTDNTTGTAVLTRQDLAAVVGSVVAANITAITPA